MLNTSMSIATITAIMNMTRRMMLTCMIVILETIKVCWTLKLPLHIDIYLDWCVLIP